MNAMTLKLVTRHLLPAAALAALIAAPAAQAQTPTALNLTLTPSTLDGNPGDMLVFNGTLSNPSTTNTVFLNGDTPTFNGPGTIDGNPFLNNAPNTLGPAGSGSDTYTGSFFDITLDPSATPGRYLGTFTITGGADGNAMDTVATEDFAVIVNPSPVPEASTTVSFGLLLALGLGGVVVVARRRKASASR